VTRIYLSPPDVSTADRAALLGAFDSGWVAPVGPEIAAFEREVAEGLGVADAAALSSGTAAIHIGLRLLGVGPGDRVMVATLTFIASAAPVVQLGAEPVFVDVDRHWTMDPDCLEEALREEAQRRGPPKAVVVVDLFGQCADYARLREVCRRWGVALLQDSAESLGSLWEGQPAGGQGDISVLSFNGNKIITTSGGGMLLSNHVPWVQAARHLATQAREPAAHYEHQVLGYNYRLSNLLAALGRTQFADLKRRVAVRRHHFEAYAEALRDVPGLSWQPEAPWCTSNRWLSCCLLEQGVARMSRDDVMAALSSQDIESRPIWKPLHLQPAFQGCRAFGGRVAEDIFARGLCLPSGSTLTDAERQRVVEQIRRAQR